jgi:hypothetical protein
MELKGFIQWFPSFLPLGATAEGELWPPEQSASISRCSSFVQTMKRRMVECRNEKNVDERGRGPLIFSDFPFIPSIRG